MPYDFGTVVLISFPFTNQTTAKRRPAVVVSGRAYNESRPDVVLMAITSQFSASPSIGDVWLTEWQSAGLLKPSLVKPVFATIEQSLITRQLGVLAETDQKSLKTAIKDVLS